MQIRIKAAKKNKDTASPDNFLINENFYGAEGIRTPDPLVANEVLSQLSYSPKILRSKLLSYSHLMFLSRRQDLISFDMHSASTNLKAESRNLDLTKFNTT